MLDVFLIAHQVFTGVVSGLILVLMAMGLALIFGLMNVVNFAHGALYMVGAYLTYTVVSWTGSFWVGLVVVPMIAIPLGLLIEQQLIRPLYSRAEEDPLLLTFGLTYVIVEVVKLIYGKVGRPVDLPHALAGAVDLGLFTFPAYFLVVAGVVLAMVAGLWLFLEKTDIGLVIRAGTRDSIMVQLLGVNFARVRTITFCLGVALACLAGVLASPIRGVDTDMGASILMPSFVVVVIGGKDSFWGTVVSGLLLGIVVALTSLYLPKMADIVMFVLMALVLLLRPRGLFGVAG